jgi:hypothetical protein
MKFGYLNKYSWEGQDPTVENQQGSDKYINLLGFKLEYVQNTCNSHLEENSSIATTKLHYVS